MIEVAEGENGKTEELLTRKNGFILVSSVLLAALYDILFFEKNIGVSYPIFIILMECMILVNIRKSLVKRWCFGFFLGFPLLALSLTYVLFSNEVFRTLNSVVIPVIFLAHVLLITEKNNNDWFRWGFLKDIVNSLAFRPLKYVRKPYLMIAAWVRGGSGAAGNSIFKKVIIGIIFSLPILIIVITLLSSADQVFGNFVSKIFEDISFGKIIMHGLLMGMIAVVTFSYLWSFAYNTRKQVPYQSISPELDEVIVITGLSLLNLVYGVFSCIQFSYLFGSVSSFLPEGFSYAEYAQRGFFEMFVVAIVNGVIVLSSINFTKIAGVLSGRVFKVLNSALLVSTFIMLLSAHCRMYLYEEVFGYTYLRVFTHAFMGMVFVLLCVALFKVWSGKLNLAKWFIGISLISYVLINYINVDVLIAEKNMDRYYKTGNIDIYYLAAMSYDTTPYLVKLAENPIRYPAAAAGQIIAKRKTALAVDSKWQSYNLSEQRAKNYLSQVR